MSALNQTYPNLEVIVVNDGSTQYSEKVVPFLSDNRVKYICQVNKGTASALNTGIRNMTGDYLAWLSSDDLFVNEKVQKQLLLMEQNHYQISYTNYSLINEKGVMTKERAGIHYPSKVKLYSQLLVGCHINGCTVMMSRDVTNKIGLFDESLTCAQDFDFWLRAIQLYELGYLDEPLTFYRVHSQMGSLRLKNIQQIEANNVIQKHTPALKKMLEKII